MWDHFVKNLNQDKKINFKESFFCGKNAGRARCDK